MLTVELATSLYLGGTLVQAEDEVLKTSPQALGLRCFYCGEPVMYKHGLINKPHFAHFPDIHESQMEKCLLRQANQTYCYSWADLSGQGREQRFKVFQQHFLKLITWRRSDFQSSVEHITESVDSFRLQPFANKVVKKLKEKEGEISLFYQVRQFQVSEVDHLQLAISREALNYVCVKSSRQILDQLIFYALFIRRSSGIGGFLLNSKKECEKTCDLVGELIFQTDWKKAFCRIPNYVYVKSQSSQVNIYESLEDGYLYISNKNLIFTRVIEDYRLEQYSLGEMLDQPVTQHRNEYPYKINWNILRPQMYENHKEKIDLFINELREQMKAIELSRIKIKPEPISKHRKLYLAQDKKQIMIGDKCVATVEPLYIWHSKAELTLENFFAPNHYYQAFMELHPQAEETLRKVFSTWLSTSDIAIPFKLS